ncbi:Crp/Fnr family transcriptional regulator [Nocardia sp. IBHARD005]|uniref:Crp/Fnr family transcriptional regulator n=1 Tax=Nocardia sp. IBHARD005 TaxID=3457765 RepID=UPI0040599277
MIHSHRMFSHLVRTTGEESFYDDQLRHAAWDARCVGRGPTAPLHIGDLTALADRLELTSLPAGSLVFSAGEPPDGVWIVRHGQIELSTGSGSRHAVVDVLGPGDIDGDIALLLDMPLAYTARTLTESECLFLPAAGFDAVLAGHPAIARRWLSSVAQRISAVQAQLINILGRPLPIQVSQLLLDEAVDGSVPLPQRTLAAMLGVQSPSLNKIVKEFERHGLINIGDETIDIIDAEGLRHLHLPAETR